MALNLDFDELMKYSLICLKINGSHPYYDFNRLWYINCFFQQGTYTCVLILMVYSITKIDMAEEIFEVCAVGSFIVIYFICSFKYFVLVNYKLSFRYLITAVKHDYVTAKTLSKEKQAIVAKYALKGRFIMKFWIVMACITPNLLLLQPLAKMLYYTVTDEFKFVQVIPIVYPPFMQDWNETIAYCTVFGFFIFFSYYSASLYLGMVPLGPIFLLHASGQLELLKMRMLNLYPDDGSLSLQQRTDELREIAVQLQAIYDFVQHLDDSLKMLYEISLKGTSLITPFLVYAMIEAYKTRGEIEMEFIMLFFGAFALSSQPCYCGDLLIEKSSNLRDAVYMSGWEGLYEKKTRSTLLILMTRMERTAAIRSIFVTVCLVALTDVVRQAYALFSLLHAAL